MQDSGDATKIDLVRSVYRGLLGREPDPGGLLHHARNLDAAPGFAALESVLRDFIGSEEFRLRTGSVDFADLARPQGPDAGEEEPISHVVGIGTSCFTAFLQRRWRLRNFAGPFDWIFSSEQMVEHALRDDFRLFLSPDQYERVETPAGWRCHHRFYGGMVRNAPIFNHHDPLSEADHQYFRRCVDRFRQAVQGPRRTLLVQMAWVAPDSHKDFQSLAELLDGIAPRAVLNLFVVSGPTGRIFPELGLIREHGRHRMYHLFPVSYLSELGFTDRLDDVAVLRALSRHRLELRSV